MGEVVQFKNPNSPREIVKRLLPLKEIEIKEIANALVTIGAELEKRGYDREQIWAGLHVAADFAAHCMEKGGDVLHTQVEAKSDAEGKEILRELRDGFHGEMQKARAKEALRCGKGSKDRKRKPVRPIG